MVLLNKRRIAIISLIVILLLVPAVGMLFSEEIDWSAFDFLVAGTLLGVAGVAVDLIAMKVKRTSYKVALLALVILAILMLWSELAVGVFNSPIAGS